MLIIVPYLLVAILADPEPNCEQLATDYFFRKIWEQKYTQHKSIEFDSRTDTSFNVGEVYGCRKWSDSDLKEIEKGEKTEVTKLGVHLSGISVKKISRSKRLKLFVGSRIRAGNMFVVQIKVYKPFEFVDHYCIKFDQDGQIIDICEFGEVI